MLSELWETLSALVLMQNVASATKILVMRHAMPATFLIRYACPAPALPFHQLLRLKVKAVQRLRKQLAPGELSTVNSKSVSPAFAHDFHIIIINAFLVPPMHLLQAGGLVAAAALIYFLSRLYNARRELWELQKRGLVRSFSICFAIPVPSDRNGSLICAAANARHPSHPGAPSLPSRSHGVTTEKRIDPDSINGYCFELLKRSMLPRPLAVLSKADNRGVATCIR